MNNKMKNQEALYRKYRFDSFNDIFGQEHISRTLKNAIKLGKVSHAYLFSGPRGTGKTSTARLLAKALNCLSVDTIDPCGKCENCLAIESGNFLDVIELDAASHTGVDHIRSIIDESTFHPTQGKYKIYIIDEAHMLSKQANNAFLKTLEEPPEHVIFILATTEAQKIIGTIHSRCQCYNFKRISYTQIVERLQKIVELENLEDNKKIEIDLEALTVIAKSATGSMRDGISTLEQVIAFSDGRIKAEDVYDVIGKVNQETLLEFIFAICHKDVKKGLLLIEELTESGANFSNLFPELILLVRNILLVSNGVKSEETLESSGSIIAKMEKLVKKYKEKYFLEILKVISNYTSSLRNVSDLKLHTELMLIEAISATKNFEENSISTFLTEEFLDRIISLESKVSFVLAGKNIDREFVNSTSNNTNKIQNSNIEKKKVVSRNKKIVEQPSIKENNITSNENSPNIGEITIDSITNVWEIILKEVKSMKAQTGALLIEGTPVSLEGDKLVILFPSELEFHVSQLSKPEKMNEVELAIFKVLNKKLNIEIRLNNSNKKEKIVEEKEKKEEDMVATLLDLFGGKIES